MKSPFFSVSIFLFLMFFGFNTSLESKIIEKFTFSQKNYAPLPDTTIILSANDQMQFDKTKLKVRAGEKVKLILKHTGTMPETVMGHNFVLLSLGTDIATFAQAAMKVKANEYIPSEGVIAYTEMIGGGESTSIEFIAPKKGTYDFICSFPGHFALMQGKFIVE